MDWPRILGSILRPLTVNLQAVSKRLVRYNKINVIEFEVCQAKGVLRERPFWRTEKLDIYHLLEDGPIRHTQGD